MKVKAIEKIMSDIDNSNSENDISESKIIIISKNGAEIAGLHTDACPMDIQGDLLNFVGVDYFNE